MKILYLDCGMGASGDMLASALLELLPDPDGFVERLGSLGIPGIEFKKESSVKCGIRGTHLSVFINGEEESCVEHCHDHDHSNDHDHVHEHHQEHDHECSAEHHGNSHHHSSMENIRSIVKGLNGLPEKVAEDVLNVYSLIAEAESAVHGVPVADIHFHEVGTMDAVADITAVCLLINELAPDKIVVSPVHVGCGQVKCAHGILPVPAPATAYLLKGSPIYGGSIGTELCTPTGAALLKYFANSFGSMPMMKVSDIGYGMGRKDLPAANCLRAMIGEGTENAEIAVELSCNVDDMTAEDVGFAMERLFEGGALDVYTVPVGMKKSRPGTLIRVVCLPDDKESMIRILFRHTSTIGVREYDTKRYRMDRKIIEASSSLGEVRIKESSGMDSERSKYEYEDVARIAREKGLSLSEVREMLDKEIKRS